MRKPFSVFFQEMQMGNAQVQVDGDYIIEKGRILDGIKSF
jgi:hypothetical protein